MGTGVNEQEQRVMSMLLAGEDEVLSLLRAQFQAATVTSRKMTGVGFFTDFYVPESVARVSPPSFVIADVSGRFEQGTDAGFALFVKSGVLRCIEGFTYGSDQWPSGQDLIEIYYMHHEPPDSAMLRRCESRDIAQLRANWGR